MRLTTRSWMYALGFLVAAYSLRAAEFLRPDQLHPGMKGYGMSVFRGSKPERFEVEVLGVLKNAFPKQDMILIRMSGANLEKTKIIAGMSGSPVYIDGKLIGALAFGWGYENEPLAGVTPIQNMLAEINITAPSASSPLTATSRGGGDAWLQPPSILPLASAATALDAVTPRPLLTPLSLGGFSPRVLDRIAPQLERFGLLPTAGGSSAADVTPANTRIEPGGSLGVQLIRGDFNAVAVGTITYVDKNRILAFGHPFFQAGRIEAPAVLAEVHTIMSSLARSFKLASAGAEIGSMIGDWQSCIVADTTVKARMIPVSIEVANRDTGQREQYSMEVIDNESVGPAMVATALSEAIQAASGSSQDTTVRVNLTAEVSGRTIQVSDSFFSSNGGLFDPNSLAPLLSVFDTPFGHTRVNRIRVEVSAVLSRQTAEIKRAYFPRSEVRRGETIPLKVVLKPFGRPEVTETVPVAVPADTGSMRQLVVMLQAGAEAPPDLAPPASLNDFLDSIQQRHRSTELVALVPMPGQELQYRGRLLKRLPASVADVIEDGNSEQVTRAPEVQQLVVPTDWIITGQSQARVAIRQE